MILVLARDAPVCFNASHSLKAANTNNDDLPLAASSYKTHWPLSQQGKKPSFHSLCAAQCVHALWQEVGLHHQDPGVSFRTFFFER